MKGGVGKKVALFLPCVLGTKYALGQEAKSPGVFYVHSPITTVLKEVSQIIRLAPLIIPCVLGAIISLCSCVLYKNSGQGVLHPIFLTGILVFLAIFFPCVRGRM